MIQNFEVLLTSDETLMSAYHGNEFLGFGTCAPPNFVPGWLYRSLFFPPMRTVDGLPVEAPYGLRKIEAQLLKEGFNVATVSPRNLTRFLRFAKVLCIYTMDPFGFGPASTTLASILGKPPYSAQYFERLLNSQAVKQVQKHGVKTIVGGPGAWQLFLRPGYLEKNDVDCVVVGEAEKVIGKVVNAALLGKPLSQRIDVNPAETPGLEEIPDIVHASVNGLVEIGRGCCRHCEFCDVTLRPLRWYPEDKVLREVHVNQAAGVRACCFHAEDVMLYGSVNTRPREDKLVKLHEHVVKDVEGFSWSHCSLAAVASSPSVLTKVSELIRQFQPWWGAEVGIETGSIRLAEKIMPAKAHPFKAKDWPSVVREGMGFMHDNFLVPACTLIVGLPEEREEDLVATMDLVDDLKHVRSLIVPLFFVPLGQLRNEDWFKRKALLQRHKELLFQCAEHDFYWLNDLINWAFKDKWYLTLLRPFYKAFTDIVKQKARKTESRQLST
jgi:radical SAM superfamily enzyme YgiQ (UPF0313 family)